MGSKKEFGWGNRERGKKKSKRGKGRCAWGERRGNQIRREKKKQKWGEKKNGKEEKKRRKMRKKEKEERERKEKKEGCRAVSRPRCEEPETTLQEVGFLLL